MAVPARLKGKKGAGRGGLKRGHEVIGFMCSKLSKGKVAGGDGETTGAEGTGASDVVRGVADYDDVLGSEGVTGVLRGAAEGNGTEVCAFESIVGEGTEGEKCPKAEWNELGLGGGA